MGGIMPQGDVPDFTSASIPATWNRIMPADRLISWLDALFPACFCTETPVSCVKVKSETGASDRIIWIIDKNELHENGFKERWRTKLNTIGKY